MDTLSACKAAVAWVKSRTTVIAKQHSLRAAVDAADDSFRESSFNAPKKRGNEKRK
jgi:hypothetical protein